MRVLPFYQSPCYPTTGTVVPLSINQWLIERCVTIARVPVHGTWYNSSGTTVPRSTCYLYSTNLDFSPGLLIWWLMRI